MRGLGTSLRVVFAVLLLVRVASAQTTSGTITGHIVDSQGLPVPGATVTVEGPNLQRAVVAISSEHGDYVVPHLPPGSYEISFELSGFERQQKMVNIAPTQTLPINIVMGPAAIAESVDVVGRTALTQTAQ